MSEQNEEIKMQTIQQSQPETNETKEIKEEKAKFKQEKVKPEKTKKKTWKKVFWAIVITLIIGIIGGAVGLYYAQEKTDWWFIVPSTLSRKVIKTENENKDKENKKTEQNITTETDNTKTSKETEEKESKTPEMDEAYASLEELYKIAINMHLNYPADYFKTDSESHPAEKTTAIEITNYDEIVNKYFTKSAKADYEEYAGNTIIKENDKTYMEPATGVMGIDYMDTVFTKVVMSESEISSEVDNLYNDSFDDMKVSSDGSVTMDTRDIKIKHVKSKFKIKKVNGNWKIDEFDFNGIR